MAAGCRWHDDAASNKMCRLGAGGAATVVKTIAELTGSGINQSSVESQEGPSLGSLLCMLSDVHRLISDHYTVCGICCGGSRTQTLSHVAQRLKLTPRAGVAVCQRQHVVLHMHS